MKNQKSILNGKLVLSNHFLEMMKKREIKNSDLEKFKAQINEGTALTMKDATDELRMHLNRKGFRNGQSNNFIVRGTKPNQYFIIIFSPNMRTGITIHQLDNKVLVDEIKQSFQDKKEARRSRL